MDATAVVIIGIVAVSLVALVAMARRRTWNVDGSDDDRREEKDRV